MPACRFVIAGSGQDERRLRARAELLGVEAAISWVGWVPEPDSVLDRSHVYVNPLAWEGFGMATAEAMACALPVVAVDSGASAEIVDHGVTGLLVAEGDPTAFAEAILYLVTDRQRAAGMGRAARNHAVERYGVDKTAQATLAFYEKLFVESSSP
jgi:glycosyltransferase involved in cell wall biosynthesis